MPALRKFNRHPAAAKLLLGLALLIIAQPALVNTYLAFCPEKDAGGPALSRIDPGPAAASPGLESTAGADERVLTRREHKASAGKSDQYDARLNKKDPAKPKPAAPAALPSRGQSAGKEREAGQPSPPPRTAAKAKKHDTVLNGYVQQVISTYRGHYPYLLNADYANYNGVSEDLYFAHRLLAKAHPSGNRATHCVGITFEVFFKAMQARNRKLGLDADDFNKMTFDELYDFMLIWYVACGNKQLNNIEIAVEKYGLGRRIGRFEDARAGDFMDISRTNGTGHTVVFQNWIRSDDGRITGIRYWSSQESGVGFNTEYFDSSGYGNVCFNRVYIARVLPVHRYKKFR